jgi:hypothetical protein
MCLALAAVLSGVGDCIDRLLPRTVKVTAQLTDLFLHDGTWLPVPN